MKPTYIQKQICNTLETIIETWKDTNDITSPTHYVDMHEFINADLCDMLSDNDINDLANKLADIFDIVKKQNK